MKRALVWPAAAFAVAGALWFRERIKRPPSPIVPAVAETAPVPDSGDAADDPAIFVSDDPQPRALILGTDKKGGLGVYDLDGRELLFLRGTRYNNVDLRVGVPWQGQERTIVAATNKSDDRVDVFVFSPAAPALELLEDASFDPRMEPEGICLHRRSGGLDVFVVGEDDEGDVLAQWRVDPEGARRLREVRLESKTEGLCADDERQRLYVAEEDRGVWRFHTDPEADVPPVLIARVGWSSEDLRHDVEGIALYVPPDGKGLLLVSSQGSDDFCVFERDPPHRFLGRFRVALGSDRVTHTDGIDATARPVPPRFPDGIFVCQDDENDGGNQNFKIVSMRDVLEALGLR